MSPIINPSGGGGGGSQTVLLTSVTLTAAQVLTADSVPVDIVPAPGGRKYIWPFSSIAHYRAGTTPYDADVGWYLGVGNAAFIGGHSLLFANKTGLNQATDQYTFAVPQQDLLAASAYENLPLSFTLSDMATGGNGTLTVRVTYAVIDGAP